MEKTSRSWVLLLALWALLIVPAAQATEDKAGLTVPWMSASASNDSCANVNCQQGTCIPNNDNVITNLIFPYKCQCNPGWATLESVIPFLAIPSLPCNIPNCTLNMNCAGNSPAAAPAAPAVATANTSACLVPGICGNGKCEIVNNNTLVPSFKCTCNPGYANVLNLTAGYCVSECEIGGNCQNLGITLPGLGPPPPPPGPPADQTASPPNAGTTSPGTGLGTPGSSPGTPGGQSAPASPGCRRAPLSGGFFYAIAVLALGSLFASY